MIFMEKTIIFKEQFLQSRLYFFNLEKNNWDLKYLLNTIIVAVIRRDTIFKIFWFDFKFLHNSLKTCIIENYFVVKNA